MYRYNAWLLYERDAASQPVYRQPVSRAPLLWADVSVNKLAGRTTFHVKAQLHIVSFTPLISTICKSILHDLKFRGSVPCLHRGKLQKVTVPSVEGRNKKKYKVAERLISNWHTSAPIRGSRGAEVARSKLQCDSDIVMKKKHNGNGRVHAVALLFV